ncbi:nicotinate-nucleotide adenylyltransferase [Candidatus Mycoplasma haematolamae str. Purdue]|uniref:Probable nicotinate-nucleotide adenylyltransferase n=1 Tax=Mycoplasma haematolamae (strain Purdue) TaxID=1212765 RepID=I7C5C5_MYCHA|nr:nicotinate (nicotinamide) nucleotide adenylyltransferase [Candidatus Mycoplasma haematolamae]AFO51712.1 nicotinate-nucleotide adenylyltransferase [Candidatus Mycoplasma haematolamae str. Purdue]
MYPYRPLKIGLFGGSFNPPHEAHRLLAREAIKSLSLDLLIFIPAHKSVEKQELDYLEGNERKNMLSLIKPSKSVISSFELDKREALESIVTVRYFREKFPDSQLYFLFGEDHVLTLPTWQDINEIFELAIPVVFKRDRTSTEVYEKLDRSLVEKLRYLDNKMYNHSSSSFRSSLNYKLLSKSVQRYIRERKLYNS